MFSRLFRYRRSLSTLALVATGIIVGNIVSNGGRWQAQVAPPAQCGNSRCEIGERGTIRIPPPPLPEGRTGKTAIGGAVAYAGDVDNNGAADFLAVGSVYEGSFNSPTTKNIWLVKMETDGRVKEYEAIAESNRYRGQNDYGGGGFGAGVAVLSAQSDKPRYVYSRNEDWYPHYSIRIESWGGAQDDLPDLPHWSLANIGDIDNNGTEDLAVNGVPSSNVKILLLNSFSPTSNVGLESMHEITYDELETVLNIPELYGWLNGIAPLGDLDGDGKKEIAVGDNNTVFILSLNTDGSVASGKRIVPGESFASQWNFADEQSGNSFGKPVANVGDWNGDGITDLAVGGTVSTNGIYAMEQMIWILYLDAQKNVKGTKVYFLSELGMFAERQNSGSYDFSIAAMPDQDGDGKKELLVGQPRNFSCSGNQSQVTGAVQLILSGSMDRCAKDCNFCPPQAYATAESPNAFTTPYDYELPPLASCNNNQCNAGEMSPVALPGEEGTETNVVLSMTIATRSFDTLGDFDGDGIDDLVMGGATQYGGGSDTHENEVQIVLLNSNGTQKSVYRIFEGSAGLQTGDAEGERIGAVVASLGDVDGDGVKDIAAASFSYHGPPSPHAVWILFLRANGTVKSARKIAVGQGGFTGPIARDFGAALEGIGDFDGDGIPDLAVGDTGYGYYDSKPGGDYYNTTQEGYVHLLMLKRDGTVKSSKLLRASTFIAQPTLPSDDQPINPPEIEYWHFGADIASLGDLFNDTRRFLVVGAQSDIWTMAFNADGTLNTVKRTQGTAVANAGDQDGDGKTDLAVSTVPSQPQDCTDCTPSLSSVHFYHYDVLTDGTMERLWRESASGLNFYMSGERWYENLPGRQITTIRDLDGDQKRELIVLDSGAFLCKGSSHYGMMWLVFSGARRGRCENDCASVNFCSEQYGSPVCGNDNAESGEQCGEPALPSCTGGQTCQNCVCVGGGVSSSLSSSSTIAATSSSSSSSASVIGTSSSSSSSASVIGTSSSSSVSSISLPPAICSNGIIEPGEGCEIGYSCPGGGTCSSGCFCIGGQVSSVSSAASSASTASSAISTNCGNGVQEGAEQCEANLPCPTGQYCSNCQCVSPDYCGNSTVDPGEDCETDDDCAFEQFCSLNCLCYDDTGGNCGNGVLEASEECERDHPCNMGEQCQSCVCIDVPRCGNSLLERGEQCEVEDACPVGTACVSCLCQQNSGCGNGVLEQGEQCESDGQCGTGQFCNRLSCRCAGSSTESCGDGLVSAGEDCELGQPCSGFDEICNLSNCSCVSDLVTSLCGNAQIDAGEDCDIGFACGADEICNFAGCHCIPWEPRCGDAQLSDNEECDIGSGCSDISMACDMSQCVCAEPSPNAVCGDGLVAIGEECEVGVACPFAWSCDFPNCRCLNRPVCGDGIQHSGEQCEINAACLSSDQTCDFSNCRCVGNTIGCGNTILDPNEQCDDGNTEDGDGCDSVCKREWDMLVGGTATCGNGIVEAGEQCDDGNQVDGDNCSHLCVWEISIQFPGMVEGEQWTLDPVTGQVLQRGTLLQGAAGSSGVRDGTQVAGGTPGANRGAQTIVFPGQQGWGTTNGLLDQDGLPQYFPSYYGSALPIAPTGPIGNTGPASVVVIAMGAAGGLAWMRRKRR
ncbi:MAG: FG-GAP-like repeat-containing protein [Candidatus Peregrinibacteria bacterium]